MKKFILAVGLILIASGAQSADFSGIYFNKQQNADMSLTKTKNNQYAVEITATSGANFGEVQFFAPADEVENKRKTVYSKSDEGIETMGCWMELVFKNDSVIVKQKFDVKGYDGNCGAGAGVGFEGVYKKKAVKKKAGAK